MCILLEWYRYTYIQFWMYKDLPWNFIVSVEVGIFKSWMQAEKIQMNTNVSCKGKLVDCFGRFFIKCVCTSGRNEMITWPLYSRTLGLFGAWGTGSSCMDLETEEVEGRHLRVSGTWAAIGLAFGSWINTRSSWDICTIGCLVFWVGLEPCWWLWVPTANQVLKRVDAVLPYLHIWKAWGNKMHCQIPRCQISSASPLMKKLTNSVSLVGLCHH